jgi:DNA invertase Pin-like site-specific DNA recombinase
MKEIATSPSLKSSNEKRVHRYLRGTRRQVSEQSRALRAFLAAGKDVGEVRTFVDVGPSKVRGSGYDALKRSIRQRECDIALVHEMSRLGRNAFEMLGLLELAEQNGVELHTNRGPVSCLSAVGPALVANLQLGLTRDRIKRVHLDTDSERCGIRSARRGTTRSSTGTI